MFQSIYSTCAFLKSAFIGHQAKLHAHHLAELKEQFGYDPYYIEKDVEKFMVQEVIEELYTDEESDQDEDEDGFYHVNTSDYEGKISREEDDSDLRKHFVLVAKKKSYSILKEEKESPFDLVCSTGKEVTSTALDSMALLLPTVSLWLKRNYQLLNTNR